MPEEIVEVMFIFIFSFVMFIILVQLFNQYTNQVYLYKLILKYAFDNEYNCVAISSLFKYSEISCTTSFYYNTYENAYNKLIFLTYGGQEISSLSPDNISVFGFGNNQFIMENNNSRIYLIQ